MPHGCCVPFFMFFPSICSITVCVCFPVRVCDTVFAFAHLIMFKERYRILFRTYRNDIKSQHQYIHIQRIHINILEWPNNRLTFFAPYQLVRLIYIFLSLYIYCMLVFFVRLNFSQSTQIYTQKQFEAFPIFTISLCVSLSLFI